MKLIRKQFKPTLPTIYEENHRPKLIIRKPWEAFYKRK